MRKLAAAFLGTELGSSQYAKLMLQGDEAPLSTAAAKNSGAANAFTKFTYQLVNKAPYYGNSSDNTLPAADGHPLLTDLESIFTDSESPATFSSQMVSVAKSA